MLLTIISIYPRKQNKLNISLHLETSNLGDVSGEIIPVHLIGSFLYYTSDGLHVPHLQPPLVSKPDGHLSHTLVYIWREN